MRVLPALLALLVLAASAGCFGDDGGAATTPPASTPSDPTLADPTPAATPEATPATPAPEPTPAPTSEVVTDPAPVRTEIYNASFDFASQGDPTGQSPKSQQTQAVRDGHTKVIVNITLTRSSTTPTMVPVSGTVNSPAVRIFDPDGKEATSAGAEGTTSVEVPAVAGAWTVRYDGAGTLRATVSLVAVA